MAQFYYPEGQPGPICDAIIVVDEVALSERAKRLEELLVPETAIITEVRPPNDYANWPLYTICDVDEDGNLVNCKQVFDRGGNYQFTPDLSQSDTDLIAVIPFPSDFGITDDFFIPAVQAYTCIPWDPDINIRPVIFFSRVGNLITKYAYPKSNPVTYPVNAVIGTKPSSLNVSLSSTGTALICDGDGKGSLTLKLEWDDNTSTAGVALDSLTCAGVTLTRSGQSGSQEAMVEVEAGQQLPITFNNLNSANSPIEVEGNSLCLKDGDSDDCNATFSIGAESGGGTTALSLWTEDGDRYGVWTNPQQCTLPCIQQIVTYTIKFREDDLYFFEFGADFEGQFYFDDETTPFATCNASSIYNPDLFPEARGPVIVAKQVTAGTHSLRAEVTNDSPGGNVISDLYVDNSVSWGSISPGPGTAIRQELDGFGSGLSIAATFSADGNNLVVSGAGNGTVTWSYEWDDNPNTAGKACDAITIAGSTINQTGSGSGAGSYPITYTGLGSGIDDINVSDKELKFDDNAANGFDRNASFKIMSTSSKITADFSQDGQSLLISGSGSGFVELQLLWNDDPNTSGVALETLTVGGQTWTQSGYGGAQQYTIEVVASSEPKDGSDSRTIQVTGGQTYPITYTNLNAANNPINVVGPKEICLYDGDGNDCNGTIRIASSTINTTGFNEVSGFVVPDDSPSGKYLSFGTINQGPLVVNRSASVTMDLTDVSSIKIWCIAGTDTNGGERPNDVPEVLEVNFGAGWVTLVGSRKFYDISFAQYDGFYGNWRDFDVEVPRSSRNAGQTIQFRSQGDTPEIGGTYNGLTPSQFRSLYANSGDVFGIYKFTSIVRQPSDCDNPSLNALNWATNPGGWYAKISQGAPCISAETLDWGRCSGRGAASVNAWGDFMDANAIWPKGFDTLVGQPQTITFTVFVLRDDTLTLEYSGDNTIQFFWNGAQIVNSQGSFGTSATQAIPATQGVYTVTMTVTNVPGPGAPADNSWDGNPAGGAFILSYSNGEIIRTSLQLDQHADGNMIWNTRDAVLYGYRTDCDLRDVESVYGFGFEGYVLYNNGELDPGEFIDTLKPGYVGQEIVSPGGLTTTYDAVHDTIVQAYILDITRYPESTPVNSDRLGGYDGWINSFKTIPYATLSDLRQQIYTTHITSVANGGSGEQAYQQSKGGAQGTYDSCDTRRV